MKIVAFIEEFYAHEISELIENGNGRKSSIKVGIEQKFSKLKKIPATCY